MARVSRLASFWKAFFMALMGGTFASAATRGEVEAWEAALKQNTPDAFYLYLSLYPAGDYVDEAVAALGKLGAIGQPRAITPVAPARPKAPRTVGAPYQ
ncbi:MAG: hypothetical protein U1E69_13510 [Tabrizicola sp.]|uniref:hypothetical protein n=1 Tax=Tabrizicola sp. TaxID=2005166 RepID=UPI002ABC3DF2|nr:hypothetical protein [Tabrizicola sp.]MDZ4087805.1 hypothetical protein [Tabrizicola sp.]